MTRLEAALTQEFVLRPLTTSTYRLQSSPIHYRVLWSSVVFRRNLTSRSGRHIHARADAMASPLCSKLACRMPLYYILEWSPFHIDALGIVTMIGADQVNKCIGRLVASRYSEYLPILGAYVIASNSFTDAHSGFTFFNISAGIMTTEIAGWFSRWCLAQDFSQSCASVTWTVEESWEPHTRTKRKRQCFIDTCYALTISFLANGFLLAFTIAQGDWWGLANVISMVISIIVRWYATKKNRDSLDNAVTTYHDHKKPVAKCLVSLNNGRQITVFAPSSLIKCLFIEKPAVEASWTSPYFAARLAGWIGFAAHVIAIGQAGLATQVVTVVVMVLATIMAVLKVGCDDSYIGSKLHASIVEPQVEEFARRQDAFIRLDLNDSEEQLMRTWGQMPLKHDTRDNIQWWEEYEIKKANFFNRPLSSQHSHQSSQQIQPTLSPRSLPASASTPSTTMPATTATAKPSVSESNNRLGHRR